MTMIISNTEITAKNTCDHMHSLLYNHGIEPIKYSLAIRRGKAGHEVLAEYYTCRKDGLSHNDAASSATGKLLEIIAESDPEDFENTVMLTQLTKIVQRYFEFYKYDSYKIVAVEEMLTAPMVEGVITFGLYADVIAEITTGEYRGYFDIIDHKWVNNFKTPDDLKLDPQQPKYIKTAELTGLPVRNAIFNQIRYRQMKAPSDTDLFRRSPLLVSKTGVNTVWREATETAQDILAETTGVTERITRRRQSYSNCRYCFFKDPCMADLNGQNTSLMISTQFQPRSRPLKDWMLSNA